MSNELICKICGAILENGHPYKEHKIKLADYIPQYHPKTNLLTGEPIIWNGNLETYFLNDFSNRTELKQWLKTQSKKVAKEYLIKLLAKRKEIKSTIYTPTQVELRSSDIIPGIAALNQICGDYYALCQSLGYLSKNFVNLNPKTILKSSRDLKGNPMLIDSREQSFLNFGNKTIEIQTLPVGDYTVKKDNYNIYIERKSLADFVSTLGINGFERFKKELQRAKDNNLYLIMLVEEDINNALSFEYKPHIARHTQATAKFIFHNLRELLQLFDNFQVGFCNGRIEMKEIILKIFEMKDFWKTADIQLAIDLKLFEEKI